MPRPLIRGILGARTIILPKDIDKCAFMCGSNFYETDVKWDMLLFEYLNFKTVMCPRHVNIWILK